MLSESVESIKNIEEEKKSLEELTSIEKVAKLEHENAMLKGANEVSFSFNSKD